jgi:hypothetical protein
LTKRNAVRGAWVDRDAMKTSRLILVLLMLVSLCLSAVNAQELSLAGRWNWGAGGGITELLPDGTGRDARGNHVQWSVRDAAARTYTLRWSHGYTDSVALAPDGRSLTGRNQNGMQFTATRVEGVAGPVRSAGQDPGIIGAWDWGMGGGRVEIRSDGSGRDARGNTLQWTLRDAATRTYVLRWSHGYTDTVTLAVNGASLKGVNDRGSQFSAVRPAGEGRSDVLPQPVDLNGSWSKGLMHIWQDGANVLITATWKRADGKYVALRGEGQLQGRRAELRIRYSPMTHGPVADWRGVLTVSEDGQVIEADYAYTAGSQRDHQVYYRDR